MFLFYPETAQRSLEKLDLLFKPNRRKLICLDWEACQKGSLLHRDLEGVKAARQLELALAMKEIGKAV